MSTDLDFAVHSAKLAGAVIVELRKTGRRRKKLDRTDVTDADERINKQFIKAVKLREGDRASVHGEEKSRKVRGAKRTWIIDPLDGTGEYVDDSIPDAELTVCVGIALMIEGRLVLAVVFNPFRGEWFVTEGSNTTLNGRRIQCSPAAFRPGVPYDYSHWNGARPDLRRLERSLGKPIGTYSAIYQACLVASGRSAFAAFPGNTIHDIAPSALLVASTGRVTDFRGRRLDWSDLNHGVLYASRAAHAAALEAIAVL